MQYCAALVNSIHCIILVSTTDLRSMNQPGKSFEELARR